MIDLNYEILRANIKDLIKQENLTQAQFAEKIGMSQPNLNKCLQANKKNRFTLDEVYSISVVFNKTIDELILLNQRSYLMRLYANCLNPY